MNVQSLAFLAFLTVTVCACRLLGRKAQVRALLAACMRYTPARFLTRLLRRNT